MEETRQLIKDKRDKYIWNWDKYNYDDDDSDDGGDDDDSDDDGDDKDSMVASGHCLGHLIKATKGQ